MSFGGFLDNSSTGGGGVGGDSRIVADIPYSNNNYNHNNENDNNHINNDNNNMPSTAIAQPRLVTQSLTKSMFNSPGLSLALVRPKNRNQRFFFFACVDLLFLNFIWVCSSLFC